MLCQVAKKCVAGGTNYTTPGATSLTSRLNNNFLSNVPTLRNNPERIHRLNESSLRCYFVTISTPQVGVSQKLKLKINRVNVQESPVFASKGFWDFIWGF